MRLKHPKVGMRVMVYVATGVYRPGVITAKPIPDKHPPGDHWTIVMDEDGTERLTTGGEILAELPADDSPEALEAWLASR